jgi:glycosyltransferase involved in cell wall biosynthesis
MLRVTIVDMQPISPAVGGGRQRLLGLYHAMGPEVAATYVGTYDWPGESFRDIQLTEGLREICVPLEDAHFDAASRMSALLGGATVIDAAFPEQVHLSPGFLRTAREHMAHADVVIFTHPWCFPPLADALRPGQLVVYDSQNVETLLKTEALQGKPNAERLLRLVASSEQAVIERSDLVLACSTEDAAIFRRVFDLDPMKLRIVPNGAFTDRFPQAESNVGQQRRRELGLADDRPLAVFMGSMYGPNVEAARYINDELAPALTGITFLIMGGVGESLADAPARPNVVITGVVDDARRDALLLAADVAINPMFAGSGTNIKMFDYMAAGLPVVSTVIGARGIGDARSAPPGVQVCDIVDFPARLQALLEEVAAKPDLRAMVQQSVRSRFSWERLSGELGSLLADAFTRHNVPAAGRVAVFTTWNVACGIGEHSAYLIEAMSACGADVLIIGNDAEGHEPLGFHRDLHHAVSRAWAWDNKRWADSRVDLDSLEHTLRLARPNLLVVQHHTGFLPAYDVEMVVSAAAKRDIPVVVEFHDGRNVAAQQKQRLLKLGAQLVVHHEDDAKGVADGAGVHVIPLPVRLTKPGARLRRTSSTQGPVVAGFGFLRPYKGVLTAIRALAKLQEEFPGVRYAGWHASYGGEESEGHLAECRQEAIRLGVQSSVEIDTGFHAVEDIVAELQQADVILMPYEPSSEGASAAVNTALAAARPVVVSPSQIFRPVAQAVHVAPRHDVASYVQAVSDILRNQGMAEDMARRAKEWADRNSYHCAASRLLAFAGIACEDRRGEGHGRLRVHA